MCGIAGGTGLSESIIQEMLQKITHRGPDNLSWEIDENTYLGHTRLSIIDLSEKSNQPLWDAEHRACIVFNGEIYNYQQLREDMIAQGVVFNSQGDAEVILNLYLLHGLESLSMLEGIFSCCIWVQKSQELIIFRDNFGVKPLYYSFNEQGFYFSSEIKSLLSVPSIQKKINHTALLRTLVFLYSPGEETLLSDVKKVKPGHYLIVKNNEIIEYQSYYKWPEYTPTNEPVETHVDNILTSLETAVSDQLVADVPVGAFLSGGLDSSLLVALAKKKMNIECFTIDSIDENGNDGFEDDLPYAKRVANDLGVKLNILKATPDIAKQLPEMIYSLDELQADPAPLNVRLICEDAKNKGVKVLLSGAGGDDIFSGYRRHVAIGLEKYWSWAPKFARKTVKNLTGMLPKSNASLRRLAKAFSYADLDGDERLLSYFYWIDPVIVKELFLPNIQQEISTTPMQEILNGLGQLTTQDPLEKMLHLERSYFLVDHNFNYTDKMSMSTGIEVRVPFLDKKVVNTAAKIPSDLKQHGKVGKWILKKAGEKYLAKNIIYRSKSGFGAPLRKWLKNDLASMVDDLLSEEKVTARGIFDVKKIHQLIEQDRSGEQDYSYPIFALLCFEIWCQKFIDD